MGGELVTFLLLGEYQPNPAVIGNHAAPKFSRLIRLFDSFTQNFSRKADLLNSSFVWQFSIMTETY